MKASIPMNSWMDFPVTNNNRIVQGILKRMNPRFSPVASSVALDCGLYWDDESFGLQRVSLFQKASLSSQKAILKASNLMLLKEAFAIERAGMAFASKMVLLSDDVDSRILYCQFAAQEASHYQMIASHIQGEPQGLEADPFLSLLKTIIERGGRMSLTLIIQVLLEGWGLVHYRKLQKECLHEPLSQDLKQILADEAHHHGSGVAFFEEDKLTGTERDTCLAYVQQLLAMVQIGPVGVLNQIASELGPLSELDTLRSLDELEHPRSTENKLSQIRAVMKAGGAHQLTQELESSFKAYAYGQAERGYHHA